MSNYPNPTAIGAVDREIRMMRKRAEQIKRHCKKGQLTDKELESARKQLTGIYARFLREAMEE